MSAAPASRRRVPPRCSKWLIGALLILVPVLAPIEAPDLPEPLDSLAGTADAHAQTPPSDWSSGTPTACPTTHRPWTEDGANCVLITHACPRNPLTDAADPLDLMRLSVVPTGLDDEINPSGTDPAHQFEVGYALLSGLMRYPAFCELRVESDHAKYSDCLTTTGFAVMRYDDQNGDGDEECRLLHPVKCPVVIVDGADVGLRRLEARTCQAVIRRTWTCDAGYELGNRFNECYRTLPASSIGTHPACGPGAPALPLIECPDYVGVDFPYQPGDLDCVADYDTGYTDAAKQLRANSRAGASSTYWCQFDAALLQVECHATPTPSDCSTDTMLCVKRLTGTGGCSLIADTIRCRKLQWDFSQGLMTAQDEQRVRGQGCQPCTPLPFESVPNHCPDHFRTAATSNFMGNINGIYQRWLLREQRDVVLSHPYCRHAVRNGSPLSHLCITQPTCSDPPAGRLEWSSSHALPLAVVNSPVILSIEDLRFRIVEANEIRIPARIRTWHFGTLATNRVQAALVYYHAYEGDTGFADSRMLSFNEPESGTGYSFAHEMVQFECFPLGGGVNRANPVLQARIEQLWPDDPAHYQEIRNLFGNDALAWWDSLGNTEKELYIERHGLRYLGTLTAHEQDDERQDRLEQFTQEVDCNATTRHCRWTPSRPGFYRAKGIGAWISQHSDHRRFSDTYTIDDAIRPGSDLSELESVLLNHLNGWDITFLQGTPSEWTLTFPPQGITTDDNQMGFTVEDIGFESGLSRLLDLPHGSVAIAPMNREWLYSEDAPRSGCRNSIRAFDNRVTCGTRLLSGNYTETEPIGIMVHEVRTSTVTPSR